MNTRLRRARHDSRLELQLTCEQDLLYAAGADAALDRPAHVRAASALAWLGSRLAVVQDDANFIALVDVAADPAADHVASVALPALGGLRQFDTIRGNKADKLDLEACVATEFHGRPALVAFGSGSTLRREQLVFLVGRDGGFDSTVVHHPRLYRALRSSPEFSGSELNVEGAVLAGRVLTLFQRGNGAPSGDLLPVNASADVDFESITDALSGKGERPVSLTNVVQYDLGRLGEVALTFTDATAAPGGRVVFLATAEASPDTYQDGVVTGTVAGVIDGEDVRFGWVVEPSGARLARKAEGILLDAGDPRSAYVAFDPDDPARPATLARAVLAGPWW